MWSGERISELLKNWSYRSKAYDDITKGNFGVVPFFYCSKSQKKVNEFIIFAATKKARRMRALFTTSIFYSDQWQNSI